MCYLFSFFFFVECSAYCINFFLGCFFILLCSFVFLKCLMILSVNYIRKEILGSWLVEMCVGLVGFTVEELRVCNAVVSFVLFSCPSHVWLFVTPWFTTPQAPLSFIISQSLLRFTFFESVMLPNHFIFCHTLLILPYVFPSIRVFSKYQYILIMSLGYDPKFTSKKIFLSSSCVGGSWQGRW